MIINNIFANNLPEAKKYYDLLKSLMKQTNKGFVIPYYYYVPREVVELERVKRNSQTKIPSDEIYNDSFHLYTQAIFLICELLVEKVLLIQDLDPIRRYLQPSERPRQSKRYSTFKVSNHFFQINY
jgi:hypothetical protein